MRALVASLTLVAATLLTPLARADEVEIRNAQARFDEGRALASKGQYDEARVKFVQAYAVLKSPDALYNLAYTETRSLHPVEALTHFRKLVRDPKCPKDLFDRSHGFMVELEKRTAHITVHAPDGADVSVDGVVTGRAPLVDPVDVIVGSHTFGIALNGKTSRQDLRVEEGQSSELTLTFPGETPPAVPPPLPPPSPPFWNGRRFAGAAVAGAGLVAGGIGIGFGISASGNASDAVQLRAGKPPNACVGVTTGECATLSSKANAAADQGNVAVALGVAGGALFVTGAILFLLPSSAPESKGSASAIQVSPTFGGFIVSGHF